jgi:hypothetical protein
MMPLLQVKLKLGLARKFIYLSRMRARHAFAFYYLKLSGDTYKKT